MRLYGNAFSADPGRCFRLVYREDTEQPMRCPGPVTTRGWWRDAGGSWWRVDACPEHAQTVGLEEPGRGARMGVAGQVPHRRPSRPEGRMYRRRSDLAVLDGSCRDLLSQVA